MTLREKLIHDIDTCGGPGEYSIQELPYELDFSVLITNGHDPADPNINPSDYLDYDPNDPWDFENFAMLALDLENSTVKVVGGGDWQDPLLVVLHYENDMFTPVEGTIVRNADWNEDEQINELQLNELLGISHEPRTT
jgi:hypothetical protein